jgi:hypothetical protein
MVAGLAGAAGRGGRGFLARGADFLACGRGFLAGVLDGGCVVATLPRPPPRHCASWADLWHTGWPRSRACERTSWDGAGRPQPVGASSNRRVGQTLGRTAFQVKGLILAQNERWRRG